MLRLSLLAVALVCALAQHPPQPAAPTYPPGHPGRAAHDAINQQQNNPLYNPHHAEYFRSLGQTYNPGAPPAAPQQQQHAPQAVPAQHQQQPTHPPIITHAPGHPAHAFHAQQLSATPAPSAQNNPNYNPHHAAYFASIGKPYNPPAPQPQQYQAPQQQYQAPQQHYQPPPQQYQAPQQHYQPPPQQYNAPQQYHGSQQNAVPAISNHLQLSYDIGVGKPNQGK